MWPIWSEPSAPPDQPAAPAPPAEAPAAPADAPARRTRTQTPTISLHPASTTSEQFEAIALQAQEDGRASRATGRLTPQQRLQQHLRRSRSRGQTPSPADRPTTPTAFTFPPATMDAEQMRIMIEAAVSATAAGQSANNAAIVEAAVNAAMQNASAQQQNMRKPNFPPFDPKNIDQWIRRVNAAFDRLNITSPKFKFAHLDEKIPNDKDPILNDFMSGPPTQENWDAFIAYLKKKHGRTIRQMASSVLTGTPREGRCPSQLWSVMRERAGTVTLDDIMKEQFMKALPPSVREHMQTKTKGKTGKEVADMADEYFDPDGKLIETPAAASSVNSIRSSNSATTRPSTSSLKSSNPNNNSSSNPHLSAPGPTAHTLESTTSFTNAFSDNDADDSDIHAVRFRQGQKQSFNVQNRNGRSQSRGRSVGQGGNNSNSRRNESRYNSSNNNNNKCFYHNKFGEKAEKCEPHCVLHATFKPVKGQASR